MRIVEPAVVSQDGVWTRAAWPEVDGRPGDVVALRLPLPVPAGTPYVANGWQSWSAPVVRRLGGRVERPAASPSPAAARVSPRHLWRTPPYDGDETYDVLVADGFVAGVVDGSAVLVARPHLGDLLVVREAPAAHPDVWWSTGDAETRYADLLARAGGRVDPHRAAPTGWCSWYCYWEHVTELACRRMLHRLAPHAASIDVFTVDDGYQSASRRLARHQRRVPVRAARARRSHRGRGLRARLVGRAVRRVTGITSRARTARVAAARRTRRAGRRRDRRPLGRRDVRARHDA